MHNLKANIDKISEIVFNALDGAINEFSNFRPYPNRPKVPDLQIVAMAVTAEALSIDSENLLYSKLKTDYPEFYKHLPDRSNYNRRKRALRDYIDKVTSILGSLLITNINSNVIDSMPVPVCRYVRAKKLRILKDQPDLKPNRGYNHIDKSHYFGFKFHLLISANGVVRDYILAPASEHDVTKLISLSSSLSNKSEILGDKGYLSKSIQVNLFESKEIRVCTPLRSNMVGPTEWNGRMNKQRKRIETLFSQLCDQMMFKRNYAKSLVGLLARISAKIAATTCLQFINFTEGKSLNQLKHALAI